MLKSMTAFGRSSCITSLGRFVVEIQTVNRKYLEINTSLPREFLRFDSEIKKWIGSRIVRGQLNVKILVSFENASPLLVLPNLPLARQLKAGWDKIAEELGVNNATFDLQLLARVEDLFLKDEEFKEEHTYRDTLKNVVQSALEHLLDMKILEGKALEQDALHRLSLMRSYVTKIELKAPNATVKYRQKLIERLQEVMPNNFEVDERVLKEIALYAEKIDITEEIIRFHSHLKQCEMLITSISEEGTGKKMEFMLQELNREANTIGSKSSDIEVSHLVVEIKSELEKIREQMQNVE